MIQKALRIISLHPKLAAGIDVVAALIFLWLVRYVHGWYGIAVWTLARVLWWVVISQFMFYPSYAKRFHHWLSLFFFQIGIASYFIFLEPGVAYALACVLFIILPFYSFWLVPEKENTLPVVAKSYRRWRLMQSVAGVAGLATGIFALITYQIISETLHAILVVGAGVLFTAFISSWWWYEYGAMVNRKFWFLSAFMLFMLGELAYVFLLLPWGYLVAGLVFAWIWYVLWIMIRFHLSSEGIDWKRQRWFLATNLGALALILLFIVRWY